MDASSSDYPSAQGGHTQLSCVALQSFPSELQKIFSVTSQRNPLSANEGILSGVPITSLSLYNPAPDAQRATPTSEFAQSSSRASPLPLYPQQASPILRYEHVETRTSPALGYVQRATPTQRFSQIATSPCPAPEFAHHTPDLSGVAVTAPSPVFNNSSLPPAAPAPRGAGNQEVGFSILAENRFSLFYLKKEFLYFI